MRILLWFRNDLRLHDHEPLHRALGQKAQIIPVYCFDPRQFGRTSFGFPKTGTYRAQFWLESVADLRASLQTQGSDLVVRHGKPEGEVVARSHRPFKLTPSTGTKRHQRRTGHRCSPRATANAAHH